MIIFTHMSERLPTHGKEKWAYHRLEDLFNQFDTDLTKYLPAYDYIFNNLGQISDEEIETLNNKFLVASLLALKHSQEKKWLQHNAVRLLILASEGPKGLRKGFIIYFSSRSNLDDKLLNSLPESVKSDVMNTLDIYFEKGMEKGVEKGMEKGMEKGIEQGIEKAKEEIVINFLKSKRFSVSEIDSLAGVTESFVKKVELKGIID